MHDAIATYLQGRLIDRTTGRSEDLIVDNRPRNVLFAGCLIPRPDATEDDLDSAEDFYARLAPSALQIRFLVRGEENTSLEIRPHFHVYYRVLPSFEAQRRRTHPQPDGTPSPEPLVKAYRRHIPLIPPVMEKLRLGESEPFRLGEAVNASVAAAVALDTDAIRPRTSWIVPSADLVSPEALQRWGQAGTQPTTPPLFQIDLHVDIEDWTEPGIRQVTVALVNRSAPHAAFDASDYWEQAVFDAGLEIAVASGGTIKPYLFTSLPNSYRFKRDQWGVGVNCVAQVSPDQRLIYSAPVATFRQPLLVHRDLPNADLTYQHLSTDPLPQLRMVHEAMRKYRHTVWEPARQRILEDADGALLIGEFERDLADFDREIDEFGAGIELLADPRREMVLKAFCFMNEAFKEVARSPTWRLFQLVFIVRNLVVLAARQWPDIQANEDVEVLWFPTGGGKTEAFLGLLTAGLFFDRLRGRETGVTGLVRLPLRLLSLQQFQRIVRTVAAADRLRRDRIGGKPFSVGYWIGQGGSPNKVEPADADEWERNPRSCQRWRQIRQCPYCGSEVVLRFDRKLWSLLHHCTTDQCGNKGDLPLYIVDDELYRFLPSVIVGTVDKLAAFGFQQRFCNLLGWPLTRCPQHGFSPRTECLVPRCKATVAPAVLKDPVPSLHIQDELHLLKEDLGAFDGHYETAMLRVQEQIPGGRPWKIIAATATIEQYDWQTYHLYCKRARRFPCPGPAWGDTFYSYTTEQTSRLFLGILPFNRSHINSMISVLWIYHSEILHLRQRLAADAASLCQDLGIPESTSPAAIEHILRDYEVSLTYVLTRKAGDQMAESLATQVAGYLRDAGHQPLETRSLTGQSTGQEIEEVLAGIASSAVRPAGTPPTVDAVIATSMISHGVDVDRFNFIAFFGMPRMTAEYIQASSRVGRRFPGLAIVLFSPARERDRSHFHLFGKYHEYLDRLVEPAAINRWAKFAVTHTLPGLFIGYLINVLGRRMPQKLYMENELYAALHAHATLTVGGLIEEVTRLYSASEQESGVLAEQVARGIERFLNGLRRNARRTLWQQADFKPMRSLRDVDEPIFFTASNYSARAFALWMQRRKGSHDGTESGLE